MNVLFVKPSEPLSFKTMRNCFRCGQEFHSGGSRICLDCWTVNNQKPITPNTNLSFRQGQVIDLVCKAKLNKEIAYELHLSEGTIKEYLHRIFRKLGVSNRTELAVWAITRHTQQVREYVA